MNIAGGHRCDPSLHIPSVARLNSIARRVIRTHTTWPIIDFFDVGWAFGFDNSFSDGAHFGRMQGFWGQDWINFVDKVLAQVHFNFMFNPP